MIIPNKSTNFSYFIAQLRVDYNTQQEIPYPVAEKDWKKVCNKIANSPIFISLGVPATDSFPSWQEWGKMLYNTAAK